MLAINEVNDVYCDALVCDEGYLVFASCWGRDTAIQELLARLTLATSEGESVNYHLMVIYRRLPG